MKIKLMSLQHLIIPVLSEITGVTMPRASSKKVVKLIHTLRNEVTKDEHKALTPETLKGHEVEIQWNKSPLNLREMKPSWELALNDFFEF